MWHVPALTCALHVFYGLELDAAPSYPRSYPGIINLQEAEILLRKSSLCQVLPDEDLLKEELPCFQPVLAAIEILRLIGP